MTENKALKLAIVDPDSASRAQFCRILLSGGMDVVWETESRDHAIGKLSSILPDLLVVGFSHYDAELVLFLSALSKKFPAMRILLVSDAPVSPNICYLLLMIGVDGYMLKKETPESLSNTVSVLLKGTYCFSDCFLEGLAEASEALAPVHRVCISDHLTDSERDVFRLMIKGLSNSEIATFLGITERAVRFHLRNIYDRLGVEGRGQALLKFYNAEIV